MLRLPKFSPTGLVSASICAHIDAESVGVPSKIEDVYKWAVIEGKSDVFAEYTVERFKSYIHFHLEFDVEGPGGDEGDKVTSDDVLTVPSFTQQSDCGVTVSATFSVDRLSLKADNFVRVLSGLALDRDGFELEFQSCALSVFGESPLREVRWRRSDDSSLRVSLTSYETTKINDESFKDGVALITKAFKSLLPVTKKVKSPKKVSKKKRPS